jgi:hypothetical protein
MLTSLAEGRYKNILTILKKPNYLIFIIDLDRFFEKKILESKQKIK